MLDWSSSRLTATVRLFYSLVRATKERCTVSLAIYLSAFLLFFRQHMRSQRRSVVLSSFRFQLSCHGRNQIILQFQLRFVQITATYSREKLFSTRNIKRNVLVALNYEIMLLIVAFFFFFFKLFHHFFSCTFFCYLEGTRQLFVEKFR